MPPHSIPKKLEDTILTYVKKTYLPERRVNPKTADEFTNHDVKFFARGVAAMSAYFTSERAHLPKNYLNKKELRAGYLLYFVPSNFLKVIYCLEQAHTHERFKGLDQVKILDLGSGPGTASLACAHYWEHLWSVEPESHSRGVEIVAVDQNTSALHDTKQIMGEFAAPNISFKTVYSLLNQRNIARSIRGKFNIIIAANLISEFKDNNERVLFLDSVVNNLLDDNGILIVIEPALRWTTRNLMKVRDDLLLRTTKNEQRRTMIAPCLHNVPCPMLKESDRDWCHMYLDWKCPEVITKIDALIGNRKDYLKFSYLVIARSASDEAIPRIQLHDGDCFASLAMTNLWRVVSAPMYSKGKVELVLCGQGRLLHATRQDKNASPNNADFDRAKRGDVVRYNGAANIEKENNFQLVS